MTEDPGKATQLVDLTLEFHIRPTSVMEKVSEAFASEGKLDSAEKFASVADSMCTDYYAAISFLHDKLSVVDASSLEKAAKVRSQFALNALMACGLHLF